MIPHGRTAYMDASVATASPARLLIMLFERLELDCHRALVAQRAGDHQEAHHQLVHAQDIVVELHSSLRTDEWEGGPGLAALYDHLRTQLVNANVRRDPTLTEHCLGLVTELSHTWHEAALQATAAEA